MATRLPAGALPYQRDRKFSQNQVDLTRSCCNPSVTDLIRHFSIRYGRIKGNLILDIGLFDFDLPETLIAQQPTEPRDHCRLMVLDRKAGQWHHRHFYNLPEYLHAGDLLVKNNTRVLPARLVGHRDGTGGHWECLFLNLHRPGLWHVITQTRGRPQPGETVTVGSGLVLKLVEKREAGHWLVSPVEILPNLTDLDLLEAHGHIPLPHYIRQGEDTPDDRAWYQTVFAREAGSVAAPTAGLHFTPELLEKLSGQGVASADVTLHVGIGTFQPIRVQNVLEHTLHGEMAEVSAETAHLINQTRLSGGRVVAVGTTSCRTLETAGRSGRAEPITGPTSLYIYPGFQFQLVDALITNFHLPKSSLMVLVSALAGREFVMDAYHEAIREGYRFYSYGDAMLIL